MVLRIDQAHEMHGNPEPLKSELGLSASLGASQGEFSVAECAQVLLKGVNGTGEVSLQGNSAFYVPAMLDLGGHKHMCHAVNWKAESKSS